MLRERSLKVQLLGESESMSFDIYEGLMQGTVNAPILFNIVTKRTIISENTRPNSLADNWMRPENYGSYRDLKTIITVITEFCYRCHQPGHISKNCFLFNAQHTIGTSGTGPSTATNGSVKLPIYTVNVNANNPSPTITVGANEFEGDTHEISLRERTRPLRPTGSDDIGLKKMINKTIKMSRTKNSTKWIANSTSLTKVLMVNVLYILVLLNCFGLDCFHKASNKFLHSLWRLAGELRILFARARGTDFKGKTIRASSSGCGKKQCIGGTSSLTLTWYFSSTCMGKFNANIAISRGGNIVYGVRVYGIVARHSTRCGQP
ncbi:unnamed protein product [Trichogramma brassicae]|uniref:CCHC-type domain-containing protein n=1 Tax=Trichogramma brassicae TaxID=86971 RepID=A0A6H5HWU3_9HYME|nr:unnamed protein product [Trichogramma brassicae]